MENKSGLDDVVKFIELLKVPSGFNQGENFKLLDFQKAFLKDIYGTHDKGAKRTVRRAILSMGRKNGKTALIACLVLFHLIGTESVVNGEIYSVANDREQASIVFKYAAQIVRSDPDLMSLIRIVDSTKTMVCFLNGSIYKAVSSEVGTKMGLSPTVAIYDELAQAKSRDLYDAIDTSMSAREEPLFIVISTQSNDPNHILSQLIDDGVSGRDKTTICHMYCVPDNRDDIFDNEDVWRMANPALGYFRSIEEMRVSASRAKRMPSFESTYRNLYLNQRINKKLPLIPRAEWFGCFGKDEMDDSDGVYLGLDLSGKTDLTSLVAVSSGEKSIVKAWFWKPKESLKEHEKRDRVPYSVWEKDGVIETTPGRAVQYDWVVARIAEILKQYKVLGIAYDRWSMDNFLNACLRIGVDVYVEGKDKEIAGAIRLVNWGQGFKDMTPSIDALEVAIIDRLLIHDGNPCLTWNISNAIAVSDPAGGRKFDKSKSRFRIDGAQALAMAIGLKSRDMSKVIQSSYDGMTEEEIKQRIAL